MLKRRVEYNGDKEKRRRYKNVIEQGRELIKGKKKKFWRLWKGLLMKGIDMIKGRICMIMRMEENRMRIGRSKEEKRRIMRRKKGEVRVKSSGKLMILLRSDMRCRRIGKMKKIGIKEGEGRELMRSKMKIFEKGKGSKNRRRN